MVLRCHCRAKSLVNGDVCLYNENKDKSTLWDKTGFALWYKRLEKISSADKESDDLHSLRAVKLHSLSIAHKPLNYGYNV